MNIDLSLPELRFAVAAVRAASNGARAIQEQLKMAKLTKQDTSPVTVADFACQAIVAKRLVDAFPHAVLVGEEGAAELRNDANAELRGLVVDFVKNDAGNAEAGAVLDWIDIGASAPCERFWTLDPIDGTKGYLRGDQYAIALALIENGRVVLGVLGCPNLSSDCASAAPSSGAIAVAVRGSGAGAMPLNGAETLVPLRVSKISDIKRARVLRSYVSSHTNVDELESFSRAVGIEAPPVALDSQAKYALLASGAGELLLRLLSPKQPDYREMIWDQAAGAIVVEEAGGRVTDLAGKPLDFSRGRTLSANSGVCATNGVLHDETLAALAKL